MMKRQKVLIDRCIGNIFLIYTAGPKSFRNKIMAYININENQNNRVVSI